MMVKPLYFRPFFLPAMLRRCGRRSQSCFGAGGSGNAQARSPLPRFAGRGGSAGARTPDTSGQASDRSRQARIPTVANSPQLELEPSRPLAFAP